MAKEDICAFTLRIPDTLKIRLDILASKERRSTNNLITVILQEYIDNKDVKKIGDTENNLYPLKFYFFSIFTFLDKAAKLSINSPSISLSTG